MRGGLDRSLLGKGDIEDRKYSLLSVSALRKSIFHQFEMLCGQICSNRRIRNIHSGK